MQQLDIVGKSLTELEKELSMIKGRACMRQTPIKCVYTDNPKSDAAFLKRIFGDHIEVLRDVFHVLQDIAKRCKKKSPFFGVFMNEVMLRSNLCTKVIM